MIITKGQLTAAKEVIVKIQQESMSLKQPSGKGTVDQPYIINVVDEILWLSAKNSYYDGFQGKFFRQTDDINMSLIDNFNPIGDEHVPFMGSYNGNMKKIKNLTVANDAIDLGLFGIIVGGVIENVILEDVFISSNQGGIRTFIGGITGGAKNAEITNCHVESSLSGHSLFSSNAKFTAIGGITGYAKDSIISQCSNEALIKADARYACRGSFYAGGITGAKNGGVVENCYNAGTIGNTDASLGLMIVAGIVGMHSAGDISFCYNIGNLYLSAAEDNISYFKGGIVGMNDFEQTTFIKNYYLNTTALKGIWMNQGNVKNYIREVRGITIDKLNKTETFDGWNVKIWNLANGSFPSIKSAYKKESED